VSSPFSFTMGPVGPTGLTGPAGSPPAVSLGSVSVAGAANVTLTAPQAVPLVLELTGALTASITVFDPSAPGTQKTVFNNTTGAFTVTYAPVGGTGFLIAQTKRAIGYVNGAAAFVRVTPDT
jgi:hypothetical protein